MPKRTFWFASGIAAGLGSSVWVQRRVRRTVGRYLPEKVQERATDAARQVGPTVRSAVTEGRQAMADREAALRAGVEAHVASGRRNGPTAGAGTPLP